MNALLTHHVTFDQGNKRSHEKNKSYYLAKCPLLAFGLNIIFLLPKVQGPPGETNDEPPNLLCS